LNQIESTAATAINYRKSLFWSLFSFRCSGQWRPYLLVQMIQ